ncbi:MAG: tetratricopeptide repeat protein [Candidatus Heimdallarchaeota archaeon]|nr:tetratricopeptide repeat protein [Candidatus Heimdallarchaeota archaeon]
MSVEELYQKGMESFNSSDFENAANILKQAVDTDENHVESWKSYGYALHKLGKFSDAFDALDKAYSMDPEDTMVKMKRDDAAKKK